MATNENCTSNPPSSDETPKATPNAFTPEFLKKLYDREDAPLAVASRGAVLTVRDARDDEDGGSGAGGESGSGARRLVVVQHTMEGGEQVVGHIPIWDDDVVDALRYVEALLHCNEALAQLVEAGCGPVAELLGRRLMAVG